MLLSRSRITPYPETETQRTPLATAAAGMRQRDAAGMAGFLRRSAARMFNFLFLASWFSAPAPPCCERDRQLPFS